MSEKIKLGDIVQLKSGGPLMTVACSEKGSKRFWCVWCNFYKNSMEAFVFDPAMLRKTEVKYVVMEVTK